MLNLTTLSNSTIGFVELRNVVEFYDFPKTSKIKKVFEESVNPLMPGGNKKVLHT